MSTRTITARGTQIAYTDQGEGPLVLNLHGLMQHRQPDRLATVVDPSAIVQAGFRVVSYDARGHGASSGTTQSNQYEWSELAQDLLALADELAPGEQVAAVGISMGTATIVHALVADPDRFWGAVLGAPPTAWETRTSQASAYTRMAALIESDGYDALAALMASTPEPPIFSGRTAEMGTPTPKESIAPAVLRGAAVSDLPDLKALTSIVVPALVLPWDTDPGHPVSTANAISSALPNADLRIASTVDEINRWGNQAADFFRRIR